MKFRAEARFPLISIWSGQDVRENRLRVRTLGLLFPHTTALLKHAPALCLFILCLTVNLCQASPALTQLESTSSATTPRTQAIGLYNLGLKAYREGSPESAIIFFRRATDIDPTLADAQYNLGVIYMTQKRYQDAVPRFQQVLQVKPNDTDALYQLGVIMQQTEHLDDAKNYFSSISPNSNRFADAQSHLSAIASLPAGGTRGGSTVKPAASQSTVTQPSQPQVPQPSQPQVSQIPQLPGQFITGQSVSAGAVSSVPSTAFTSSQGMAASGMPVLSPPIPVISNIVLKVIAGGFSAPSGLAIDKSGNLYVANYTSNTIDRVNADGIRSRFSSAVGLKGPIGLALDGNNNLYVANYDGGTVLRINPAGVAVTLAKGFHKPYYLTLDHNNNLYVSQQEDNSVVRIMLSKPAVSSN